MNGRNQGYQGHFIKLERSSGKVWKLDREDDRWVGRRSRCHFMTEKDHQPLDKAMSQEKSMMTHWKNNQHRLTNREEGVVGLELAGYDFNIEVGVSSASNLRKILADVKWNRRVFSPRREAVSTFSSSPPKTLPSLRRRKQPRWSKIKIKISL